MFRNSKLPILDTLYWDIRLCETNDAVFYLDTWKLWCSRNSWVFPSCLVGKWDSIVIRWWFPEALGVGLVAWLMRNILVSWSSLLPSGSVCCILSGTFHANMRGKQPYRHIKAPRGVHKSIADSFWRGLSPVTMTPAELNICLKQVEEWSGLEALLLLRIIPGSVFHSTCQHSNCVGLAAATVILVSIWCFRAPENSTTSARCPPSCYYPDCFKFRGKARETASFCLSLSVFSMYVCMYVRLSIPTCLSAYHLSSAWVQSLTYIPLVHGGLCERSTLWMA